MRPLADVGVGTLLVVVGYLIGRYHRGRRSGDRRRRIHVEVELGERDNDE